MRLSAVIPKATALACAFSSHVAGQEPHIMRIGPNATTWPSGRLQASWAKEPRAVIGVSTTSAATSRDTLGVFVAAVRQGSPAEKAGIEEGNRIASVNGVSLRLAASDVGDEEMAGVLARRLNRELDKLRPGDEVDLRIYAGGQSMTVKVRTVAPSDLYSVHTASRGSDRATLGLGLAATGSIRDTLGVFVMSVDDGGPAAKAGIEEGSRIASINGIDVRDRRAEAGDDFAFRSGAAGRLAREISRLKPGDDAELRVYYTGQFRTVRVKAGRLGDMPHHHRSTMIFGGDSFVIPPMPNIEIDGAAIGGDVRRAMESLRGKLSRLGDRTDW